MLSSLPQHHPSPIAADPVNRRKMLCPRASFTCYALWFGIIWLDGSAPNPTVNASEAPDRGLEAVPTAMVGYGYTTTNSGPSEGLIQEGNPFDYFSSWHPPYFLTVHSIRGVFEGPSKWGLDSITCSFPCVTFVGPKACPLAQGNSTGGPRGRAAGDSTNTPPSVRLGLTAPFSGLRRVKSPPQVLNLLPPSVPNLMSGRQAKARFNLALETRARPRIGMGLRLMAVDGSGRGLGQE